MSLYLLRRIVPLFFVISFFVAGCALAIRTDNPGGDGAGFPEEMVGVLYGLWRINTGNIVLEVDDQRLEMWGEPVDGRSVWHTSIKLQPGEHTIFVQFYTLTYGYLSGEMSLDVKPGHQYEFKYDGCRPVFSGVDRSTIWIEDLTEDRVVAGKQPDWNFWCK